MVGVTSRSLVSFLHRLVQIRLITAIKPCWVIAAITAIPWHRRSLRARSDPDSSAIRKRRQRACCAADNHLTPSFVVFLDLRTIFMLPTRGCSGESINCCVGWDVFVGDLDDVVSLAVFLCCSDLVFLGSLLCELDLREYRHYGYWRCCYTSMV